MRFKKCFGIVGLVALLAVACGSNPITPTAIATQTPVAPKPSATPQTTSPTATALPTQTPAASATPIPTALSTQAPAVPGPSATPQATSPTATALLTQTSTPEPQATGTVTTAPSVVALKKVVDGLEPLTYLTYASDSMSRLYLVAKSGRVLVLENGTVRQQPFLDITDRVGSSGSEQGLLSIAFSPHYANDNTFFVDYTDTNGDTVVSRFTASLTTTVANAGSESIVLTINQPYPNHNGGQLQFGPDGMLYIGMGDGGSAGDPHNNGQNIHALLAKLLRIDVTKSGKPYAIPADNPALGGSSPSEVWAYGLRNPWRFSFDRKTSDLYIADVGQNKYEEIDFQPAGDPGGENYGWNLYEGFESYKGNSNGDGLTMPIYAYGHDLGCSVTGGYVYRGTQIPALAGAYLYSDYCSGHIWSLRRSTDGKWQNTLLVDSGLDVSSFGEDPAGELYVVALSGAVYQITPP